MRGRKFSRHWLMLAYLLNGSGGKRLEEIAREVGCSIPTVRRDLAMLQAAGFPIEKKRAARQTIWHLKQEFRNLPPVPFGPLEAAALAMAEKRLRAAGDEFFGELVAEMLTKLKQGRKAQVSKVVQRLEESFVGLGGAPERARAEDKWPEEISRAIRSRLKVEVDCREGRRTWKKRPVAPLRLWVAERKTLVQAFCYERRSIRTFEIGDLRKLRVLRETFAPEWEFDPEGQKRTLRGNSRAKPQPVELEFETQLEQELRERPLHHSQQLTRRDGYLVVHLTVPVGEALVHELMRYGARVRVIRPMRLGKLLSSHHRAAVAAFEERLRREEEAAVALPLVFD